MCIGFKDKLYWRDPRNTGIFHCFKKYRGHGFAPLCGRGRPIKRSGGQAINRPEPMQRCGQCDQMEMRRRDWNESGPATVHDGPTPLHDDRCGIHKGIDCNCPSAALGRHDQ